jgi:hypothetical protein
VLEVSDAVLSKYDPIDRQAGFGGTRRSGRGLFRPACFCVVLGAGEDSEENDKEDH